MKSEQPNWKQMADEELLLKRIFNTFIMKKIIYWCQGWTGEDRMCPFQEWKGLEWDVPLVWCSWSEGRVLLLVK